MRVLCLVDGPVLPPDRWMWNHLPQEAQSDEVDFLWSSPADRFAKWGKLISYYPQYLLLGWRAVQACRRNRYDVITAWESKTGFPTALLRRLFGELRIPLLILAFSFKGVATHFIAASRWVLQAVTAMTVASPAECRYYHDLLHVPEDRIIFCPVGWHDICKGLRPHHGEGGYILASGRSHRDYRTFLTAAASIRYPMVVATRRFALRGIPIPPAVTVKEYMPEREYAQMLAAADFVVVPLQDVPFAAGIETIVQAMSASQAVVATDIPCVKPYVMDGVTGILVPPYDAAALCEACEYLASHPAQCVRMGECARQRYEAEFTSECAAHRQYEVIRRLAPGADDDHEK